MRLELEAVENRRIVAGGDYHSADSSEIFHGEGNGRRRRWLRREDDLKTISRKNFGGDSGETVGEKPAVKTDDDFQFTIEDFGLWTLDFGLPIVRRGLRDARDVGEREIFRDDRAPAVRAEFDWCHARSLAKQFPDAKHGRLVDGFSVRRRKRQPGRLRSPSQCSGVSAERRQNGLIAPRRRKRTMERELSQLAAGGMTKDGWIILMLVGLATCCGLGQSALRGGISAVHSGRILFWTVGGRAPAPRHLGSGSFPVVPLGRTPCQNHFALDVWGNARTHFNPQTTSFLR